MPFLTYAGGSDSISVILSDMSLPDSVRIKKAVDFLMKRSAKEKKYVSERFEAVIKFALEKKEEKLSLQAAYMKGVFLFKNEDYGEAMQVLQNTAKNAQKKNNREVEVFALHLLSEIYMYQSNYKKCIEILQETLNILQNYQHSKITKSLILNKLGKNFEVLLQFATAKEIYTKAFEQAKKDQDNSIIAFSYSNLANVHGLLGAYDSSLFYHKLCIEMREKDSTQHVNLPFSYNDIAEVLDTLGKYDEALFYIQKGYDLLKNGHNAWAKSVISSNYAELLLRKKDYKNAQTIAEEALNLALRIRAKDAARIAHGVLYAHSRAVGDDKAALFHYRRERIYADSINEENKAAEISKLENNFKLSEKEKEYEILSQKSKNQQVVIFATLFGILLTFILIFVLIRNNRKQKKANLLLHRQKEEISLQREEIGKIAENLHEAYLKLDAQNADTMASIRYAKRIQQSLLPDENLSGMPFKEAFVFYQPKDIVSGDFFQTVKTEEGFFVIAADCTGHGVPGALMSMIGINLLNDIIGSKKTKSPAEILKNLNANLTKILQKEQKQSADGMDISILFFDNNQQEFRFSGAMNDALLFYYPENAAGNALENVKILVLKADNLPFGTKQAEKKDYGEQIFTFVNLADSQDENALSNFSEKTIFSFFLFSDGFKDQFGGAQNKKYMSKNFKNFLHQTAIMPAAEQKKAAETEFLTWKGNFEQTDDVMLLGFKIEKSLAELKNR